MKSKNLPPFYTLSASERIRVKKVIYDIVQEELSNSILDESLEFFASLDTYIRKVAYLSVGDIYRRHATLRAKICKVLTTALNSSDHLVRQTAVNAVGEIAKIDFDAIKDLMQLATGDLNSQVRNAVIGSLKKAGNVNILPVLNFCKVNLSSTNPEIRRQMVHGLELRGRTYPQEVLPALKVIQWETHRRVRPMTIHVVGQMARRNQNYKYVIDTIMEWDNRQLIRDMLDEITWECQHAHNTLDQTIAPPIDEALRYIERAQKELPATQMAPRQQKRTSR